MLNRCRALKALPRVRIPASPPAFAPASPSFVWAGSSLPGFQIALPARMGMSPVRRAFVILLVAAPSSPSCLMLAQDQVTLKMRSAVGAEDPRHPSYIAALARRRAARGNRFDVLTNGDQIFPAMLEAIGEAKRRISFETYIYDTGEDGGAASRAAFEEAARRGVKVRTWSSTRSAPAPSTTSTSSACAAAGCHVAHFNTPSWYSLEEINYRTHRKILVVDGEIGFTGGVGIDDQWKGNARNKEALARHAGAGPRPDRAADGRRRSTRTSLEAAGEMTPELDDAAPADGGEEGASFLVRSSPTGGSNDLKRLYLLALASARRSLDITTPYFVTDESTRWSLEDAVGRGVKIRLLVEGDITDAMPVKYASRKHYEQLMELGIEIYEYQPTMMHTKTLVVDGIWSMFGSANFDNRSLELNDELNVAVTSRELAARLLADFEQDLAVSQPHHARGHGASARCLMKVREHFWSAFGEVF